ncbi:MAG: cysteine synthase family protein [Chitinophagaceae bacterium]|nr:MAG: cysteine synthase family protein [Chitinophagaceae bacterium]
MISATKPDTNSLQSKILALGDRVANTPLHHFSDGLIRNNNIRLVGKMEWLQLGGSVKARAAYSIIRNAIESGELTEKTILLDATSGNTGIAYAAIAKEVGIKVSLCLPENASKERKEILTELGVDIVYTSPFEGTDGSQQVARDLVQENPHKYFYADQYKNENNWKAHYNTTAFEILNQVPTITHFVAGMGTTGTFVGTGRRLREINPAIKLIAFQPDSALHGLEGWKHLETAVVPKIYDATVADEIVEITTEEAYEMLKRVYDTEGLLLSPSSAANVAGALKVASTLTEGTIVTILPDNSDKYSEVIKRLIK